MRENEPLSGLVKIVLRRNIRFIPAGLEPRDSNSDIFGRIAPGPPRYLVYHRNNGVAGIEYVIDDQHPIVVADLFDNVVDPVNGDFPAFINPDVGLCADSNML